LIELLTKTNQKKGYKGPKPLTFVGEDMKRGEFSNPSPKTTSEKREREQQSAAAVAPYRPSHTVVTTTHRERERETKREVVN